MKIYRYLVVFKNVFEKHYHLHCNIETKQKWLKMLLFLFQAWAIYAVTLICELYLLGLFAYRFITAIFKKAKNVSSIFNLHRLYFFFFKRNLKHNCYHSSKKKLWLNLIKYIMLKTFYIDQKPYVKKRTSGKFNAELLIEMFV